MKQKLAWLLAMMVCLGGASASRAADYCECPSAEVHAARQSALDAVLYEHKTMGASIALVKDGRIVDTYQYGRANREDNVPVDSGTYFRIASITKMVSSVGMLQLVEKGALSLDAPLEDSFWFTIRNPAHPGEAITLRQVMTHTAGFKDDYHYLKATQGDVTLLEHVLDGNYTRMNYNTWAPGTKEAYSNFGGSLMGAVLEQVTGYTVDEYMNWKVFGPLSVGGGYHTPSIPSGATIARIYTGVGGSMTLNLMGREDDHYDADPNENYTHTAGALCMTAEGLAKVLIALAGDGSSYGAQLLQPETVAEMRTRQNGIGSVTCDAGRGLNLNIIEDRLVRGRTLYGHQGKAYGMICAAYFDPTDQTGVVLLTNGCDTATVDSVAKIARAVISKAYEFIG